MLPSGGLGGSTVLVAKKHRRRSLMHFSLLGHFGRVFGGGGGVFLLEVQYSILKSLISTCVLSYVGSREDWLLDRICKSKKDCWDSIRRTSYPYQ